MNNCVFVDFSNSCGIIKPMHAINNGPLKMSVRGTSNFEEYKAAGIPYARNHDASFYTGYGGEFSVDVHRIFRNFDADENDPASYIFAPTDAYMQTIVDAGTKIFYRLGASIEHEFKFGTYPPKDYAKWARICEHIIMHYNEGWADGFYHGIEYWEIWNEPDCRNHDGSNPCWQGTNEEFLELYKVASTYLKERFPGLKIGGPAFTGPYEDDELRRSFLSYVKENNIPLDFYSFHCYSDTPVEIYNAAIEAYNNLKKYGFEGVETILNEWNYVKGWVGDEWKYTLSCERGLKGSSFIASAMALCQYSPLDMLMYYDARPSVMNGLFQMDSPWIRLKGYYPFLMFSQLYKMKNAVSVQNADNIYSVAAKGDYEGGVILSYYDEEEREAKKEIELCLYGLKGSYKAEIYLLDEDTDFTLVRTELLSGDASIALSMSIFSTVFVKLVELK